MYLVTPDAPAKRPELSPAQALASTFRLAIIEPVLTHYSVIAFCIAVPYAAIWTPLAFLLEHEPFNLSSFEVGLFSLAGIGMSNSSLFW